MNPSDMDFDFASLPPEALQQLLGLGTLDERGALLQQQMAQADALRQPLGRQRTTGAGAALSGLGDAIRGAAGGFQQNALRGQQQALLGQKDAGRLAYADLLARAQALRRQQVPATAGAGDMPPLPGYG